MQSSSIQLGYIRYNKFSELLDFLEVHHKKIQKEKCKRIGNNNITYSR